MAWIRTRSTRQLIATQIVLLAVGLGCAFAIGASDGPTWLLVAAVVLFAPLEGVLAIAIARRRRNSEGA